MHKVILLIMLLLVVCGCQTSRSGQDSRTVELKPGHSSGLEDALLNGNAVFEVRELMIPPAGFPVSTDPIIDVAEGHSVLIRSAGSNQVLNLVEVSGVTPGHVYLYEIVAFNHPEHCRQGSNQFPEPSPCWSAGAGNPIDGSIEEAGHFVAAYGAKVARSNRVDFVFDLMNDRPTEVYHGSGLTNAVGAWIAVGVLDKGPELPKTDSLRNAQFNSIRGGCQGPPFFGPLRCEFVGVQQHLPK